MTTRRQILNAGAAALGAAATGCTLSTDPKSAEAARRPNQLESSSRLPIICIEEHVEDSEIGSAIREPFMRNLPYFAGLGSRYKDDPSKLPKDRPRLTFVPDSIRAAAGPLSDRIEDMNAAMIDKQVLSISNAIQLANPVQAADLARHANDSLAEKIARHPTRFSAFFTLPWQDPEAAVHEAERCVSELGLPATMISGRPAADLFLDDDRYANVLGKLASLGAPIFIHPGAPLEQVRRPYYDGFHPEVTARFSLFGWGWHHEAGIHVLRLILSGALDRSPDLKILSGHWGEMVPFYLGRLDDTIPPEATGLSRTISQTYKDQVWVHPSGMLDEPHFNFVRDVVGINRILFSIDYPYLTMSGARAWLEGLSISESDRHLIAYQNAQDLLGIEI